MFSFTCRFHLVSKKIKSALYSCCSAETFHKWRDPSPRLAAGHQSSEETLQGGKPLATLCPIGPAGNQTHTSFTDSDVLNQYANVAPSIIYLAGSQHQFKGAAKSVTQTSTQQSKPTTSTAQTQSTGYLCLSHIVDFMQRCLPNY